MPYHMPWGFLIFLFNLPHIHKTISIGNRIINIQFLANSVGFTCYLISSTIHFAWALSSLPCFSWMTIDLVTSFRLIIEACEADYYLYQAFPTFFFSNLQFFKRKICKTILHLNGLQ